MASAHLKIAFVRRGFSSSGGAEAYLQRLAAGLHAAGHETQLITTSDWPQEEWRFGSITRVAGSSPRRFADELDRLDLSANCDVLMSLERVWSCDVFRAGDGVHRAWLARRAECRGVLKNLSASFNRKHRSALRLERSLFGSRCARRVIANSQMVKQEIIDGYGYPAERIDVVYNGVPLELFRSTASERAATRAALGLDAADVAVLFAGSGWERKGLRFAIKAVEACANPNLRLLVAGRGNEVEYASPRTRFLGVRRDLPHLLAAADIFLLPTIYDPFSNACLEAAAAGLPVITTRANGFAEIIDDGVHGSILETASDHAAISDALKFWSGRSRREEAQPKILELASRYDIATNVARTLEILLQTAASAASASGKIRNT